MTRKPDEIFKPRLPDRTGRVRLTTPPTIRQWVQLVSLSLLALAVVLSPLVLVACLGPSGGEPQRSSAQVSGRTTRAANASPQPGPSVASIRGEPVVRVRVVSSADSVTINATSRLQIGGTADLPQPVNPVGVDGPVVISRTAEGFVITDARRRSRQWNLPALSVRSATGDVLTVGDRQYPSRLQIHPVGNDPSARRVDVINHVPLETYLPGVIERELYTNWDLEAYRAQCIAARSYYFWEAHKNRGRHYDLESTTASQVYGGRASNPTAIRAGQETRGVVLVYAGHVLPCFYSSTSGGVGADAHTTFRDFPDLPPLRGFEQGQWGQVSPLFTWSVQRDVGTMSRRIAAWGEAREHPVRGLRGLRSIELAGTNQAGYPTRYTLVDAAGQRFEMRASDLRNAGNYTRGQAAQLPALSREVNLRSPNMRFTVTGSTVTVRGQGYGHGVGLCQWSAQGMAQAGWRGERIVSFFYPGATLERVY